MNSEIERAATLLEEVARHASRTPGMLWRDIGVEATRTARDLRATLRSTPQQESPPLDEPDGARFERTIAEARATIAAFDASLRTAWTRPGQPHPIDLCQELREAVGLFSGAMVCTPKEAWDEAIKRCRQRFQAPAMPPHG